MTNLIVIHVEIIVFQRGVRQARLQEDFLQLRWAHPHDLLEQSREAPTTLLDGSCVVAESTRRSIGLRRGIPIVTFNMQDKVLDTRNTKRFVDAMGALVQVLGAAAHDADAWELAFGGNVQHCPCTRRRRVRRAGCGVLQALRALECFARGPDSRIALPTTTPNGAVARVGQRPRGLRAREHRAFQFEFSGPDAPVREPSVGSFLARHATLALLQRSAQWGVFVVRFKVGAWDAQVRFAQRAARVAFTPRRTELRLDRHPKVVGGDALVAAPWFWTVA